LQRKVAEPYLADRDAAVSRRDHFDSALRPDRNGRVSFISVACIDGYREGVETSAAREQRQLPCVARARAQIAGQLKGDRDTTRFSHSRDSRSRHNLIVGPDQPVAFLVLLSDVDTDEGDLHVLDDEALRMQVDPARQILAG